MSAGPRATLPSARKRFGQHFLQPEWVAKLVAALAVDPEDRFLEIGPGRGALTRPLAARAASVVAVEIDRDLAAHLADTSAPNVRVVEADFLEWNLGPELAAEAPVRAVGNLPYNVAAPILFKLFHESRGGRVMSDAVVMLQKEMAERLVAAPGTPDYGVISVYAALHATTQPLLTLPPGAFRPPPKVQSAVVRLRFHPPPIDIGRPDLFEALVRGTFTKRRKMLLNAVAPVASALGWDAAALIARAGLSRSARPGELSLADFAALSRAVL
jgi:16S rRNA (adenine1518-N6/adenine1519-N6)-dimethyltransferase